jgi:hypothetical protein
LRPPFLTTPKAAPCFKALSVAFKKAKELGAAEKAIIFTESRKTQSYLLRLLADSPFADGIVLFNGSNTDDRSKLIYAAWLEKHQGTDRVTGSKTADMRSALVDFFREEGRIMIATEAGAEGINLQFCSLVVNYDLPWNPQRIEQRIGRCHRYGQKHDVVVVNFLNRKNAADQRVYELLSEKFQLFEGVFGASDEVLGAIESGVDFEKRINDIYQRCRKTEEIKVAFDQLQLELSSEINEAMAVTRRKLLENFDDEVRDKLKVRDEDSRASLNRFERRLMQLTRHELGARAEFLGDSSFRLTACEFPGDIPLGLYELPRRSGDAHLYRLNHPLAEAIVARAKGRELPLQEVQFGYADYDGKISVLKSFLGQSGWLTLTSFTVDALDQSEDHLLFAAVTDGGQPLHEDAAARLFSLKARLAPAKADTVPAALETLTQQQRVEKQRAITERNAAFFEVEVAKLDGWAEDLKLTLEREIKDMDRQIKEARRAATTALTLEEKLAGQKQIKALESQRTQKRRSLFEAQDEVNRTSRDPDCRRRRQADAERRFGTAFRDSLETGLSHADPRRKSGSNRERPPPAVLPYIPKIVTEKRKNWTEETHDDNRLTRALAAYTLVAHAGIDDVSAAAGVVDDENDGGIDAIYFDRSRTRLVLVQAKFKRSGTAPAQDENLKTMNGVRMLLARRFAQFNTHIGRRQDEIEEALDTGGVVLHLLHVCLGDLLGEHVTNDLNALKGELNGFSEQFRWDFASVSNVHEWLLAEQAPAAVTEHITLEFAGEVPAPRKAVYGQIAASELARLVEAHGKALFERNIRHYLGSIGVNTAITNPFAASPPSFSTSTTELRRSLRKSNLPPVRLCGANTS